PARCILCGQASLCADAGPEEWLYHQFLVDLGGWELRTSKLLGGEGGHFGVDAHSGSGYGEVWGAGQLHLARGRYPHDGDWAPIRSSDSRRARGRSSGAHIILSRRAGECGGGGGLSGVGYGTGHYWWDSGHRGRPPVSDRRPTPGEDDLLSGWLDAR